MACDISEYGGYILHAFLANRYTDVVLFSGEERQWVVLYLPALPSLVLVSTSHQLIEASLLPYRWGIFRDEV
jgi:hypothetical protein